MRLLLIRHGETVDNVAGLYAGSRDSALTNHGIQQARRLGSWLADNKSPLTHVFASPLQRAFKTAEALQSAQHEHTNNSSRVSIVKVEQLVEQDFGFYEGKPFYARQRASPRKTGKEAHYDAHKDDPGFVDVESKDSLAKRGDDFLDAHLLPLFDSGESPVEHVVAVVSHGILLSNLWRRLLLRLPARSVKVAPEIIAAKGQVVLEHLGGWSNTGFLEVLFERATEGDLERTTPKSGSVQSKTEAEATVVVPIPGSSTPPPTVPHMPPQSGEVGGISLPSLNAASEKISSLHTPITRRLDGYATTILTIDGKQHLQGFKRTKGGIGRSQYDEKQKTMDSFFKRAKKE